MKLKITLAMAAMFLLCALPVISENAAASAQEGGKKVGERVWLFTTGIELVGITPTAEHCGAQPGETIKFKVTSATPIDVRLYVQVGYKQWLNKDFGNQKAGDEISDYSCNRKPNYKVYARAIGATGDWPKP
jgi:hypothetical protein